MSKMKLVLLAGQSNMAGRGNAGPDDLTEIPGLKMFCKDFVWRPAIEPLHKDRSFVGTFNEDGTKVLGATPWEIVLPKAGQHSCGVTPGRTFGRLLLEDNPGCEVGLIPTSVGGTDIAAWQPGGVDKADNANHPYDDALAMAREAQKYGEIVAILWHQGENDAGGPTPDYQELLTATVTNFRRDLGLGESVPFILGELASFYKADWRVNVPFIDEAIRAVAASQPNAAVVKTKDLPDKGDALHFDTASAHELGRRYYEAFRQLTGKSKG